MTGTIKKKTDRGFGFIAIDGEDKDVFFHSTALVGVTFDALSEGATVTFDVEDGENGRQSAKNVTLADAGEQQADASEMAPEEEVSVPEVDSAPVEESEPVAVENATEEETDKV